jgi:nitrogen-specific signal transduction histidine kinase
MNFSFIVGVGTFDWMLNIAHINTTKDSRGSGLGLSLVKDVVEEHGGSLRVRSSTTPGHTGSIFAIFLPEREAGTKLESTLARA